MEPSSKRVFSGCDSGSATDHATAAAEPPERDAAWSGADAAEDEAAAGDAFDTPLYSSRSIAARIAALAAGDAEQHTARAMGGLDGELELHSDAHTERLGHALCNGHADADGHTNAEWDAEQ